MLKKLKAWWNKPPTPIDRSKLIETGDEIMFDWAGELVRADVVTVFTNGNVGMKVYHGPAGKYVTNKVETQFWLNHNGYSIIKKANPPAPVKVNGEILIVFATNTKTEKLILPIDGYNKMKTDWINNPREVKEHFRQQGFPIRELIFL